MVSWSLLGRRSSGRRSHARAEWAEKFAAMTIDRHVAEGDVPVEEVDGAGPNLWVSFESEQSRWRQKLRNDAQARLNGPISSEVQSSGQMRLHVLKGIANAAVIRLPSEMV